jgi:hypothetical protein
MSNVRVLVGTRKGAFILTSDGKRDQWDVSGPHFAGWEVYHVKGSPVEPARLYASQSMGWFGQIIQRSDDGGKTWYTPGSNPDELVSPDGMPKGESNKFVYDTSPETGKPLGTHLWYDGTPRPWEFTRVWHLEPSLTNPETVYAGVQDAALYRSDNGGSSWQELPSLRGHDTASAWAPGAGGMCLHTVVLDPTRPERITIAISRRVYSGPTTAARPGGQGTAASSPKASCPTPRLRSATACTAWPCTRPAPTCFSCRSTGMSCAATTAASRGARSAATYPATSGLPLKYTPMSRTPSMLFPSRAMRSTTHPTGSCACTGAGPADRNGRH